jgi:DNA gyrase inhibitor GyrI
MSKLDVRIVRLEPMRVASFHAFGEGPEDAAWSKLEAWAEPRGFLGDWEQHRVFGFNNPNPSPSSPNYGYEFWMGVGPEVGPADGVNIVAFAGGLYAVSRVGPIGDPGESIPAAWKKLLMWCEDSKYRPARHQWLEEHIETGEPAPDNWTLDLYLPIAE